MAEEKDFYEFLGVEKNAKIAVIRRAYYKMALKLHPDRNENKEQATKDFQKLALIKETLFDEKKRKYYDRTGEVDETSDNFESSYEYWRARYARVTVDDIENFKKTYKNSAEEKEDLRQAYTKCKGDMGKIMESVPLAGVDDIDRFVDFLQTERKRGNLKKFKSFKTSIKKLSREEDLSEAKEAEELAQELGVKLVKEEDSLKALIQARQKQRAASFLENLEAKYGSLFPSTTVHVPQNFQNQAK